MTNNKKPSRQEMIDSIYEKIADETLSFGCRIILENQEIIMETDPCEGNCSEYYEANGVITWRYWTTTERGTTLQIEKIYFYEPFYNQEEVSDSFSEEFVFDEEYETENNNLTIIWHPVMLGDVVDYCEKYCLEWDIEKLYWVEYMPIGKINLPTNIFTLWEEKRKPITEQSDECIKFVYNLISE